MTETRDISPVAPKYEMPSRADKETFLLRHTGNFGLRAVVPPLVWSQSDLLELLESALLRWPCITLSHKEKP